MFARQSALLLRSSARPSPALLGRRAIHIENKVGSNTPFSYANPRGLAIKMIVLYGGGFCIPFAAAYYQIQKASA